MITVRLIGIVVCLPLLGVSWAVTRQTLDDLWIRGLAAGVENNTLKNDLPPSVDEQWRMITSTTACDSEVLFSGLVVVLRKLDQLEIAKNYAEWVQGIGDGERYLSHMTKCLPSDGNAWLRLAMVKRAIAESPAEVCELTRRSRVLAPSEALVLAGRLALYSRLQEQTIAHCAEIVHEDVRTILAHGRKANFETLLSGMGNSMHNIARFEFFGLSDAKKHWARREFNSVSAVVGESLP